MPKFTIYQVLPRLFGNYSTHNLTAGSIHENGCGKFNRFTRKALQEIKTMGFTHIWYTGIIEHATQTNYSEYGIRPDHPAVVKGKAGSAYAIKDYYDVDPDLAENVADRMKEFTNLVIRTHSEGLKVIIDFVPNHVAREYQSDVKPLQLSDLGANDENDKAFSTSNNFYYLPGQAFQPQFDCSGYIEFPAKVTGNDQFTAHPSVNDWYETVKLNYGVDYLNGKANCFDPIPDTWYKMRDILMFWASKKVDGFRCDMAEMVPVEFWEWVISELKSVYRDIIFIAEVYNPGEYRNYLFKGGFDYLYDKVGLYDTLRNIVCHGYSATTITNAWQSIQGIEGRMLNFLENHDEQRIASDFFAGDPWLILPALVVSATLTNAPFMVYFGQELGERGMDAEGFSGCDGRTSIFDYWGIASIQQWLNKGKFDNKGLSNDQLNLRDYYQRLINLLVTQPAIREGKMYDLQYANYNRSGYNPHRQFSFFRHHETQLILIVANFDQHPVKASLHIPVDALNYLHIQENTLVSYKDLLKPDDNKHSLTLCSHTPVEISVEANLAVVLMLELG